MKPKGILTEQDYQSLASELEDYHDPENFLDNCEKEYLTANQNFYSHLHKAALSLIFPESQDDGGLVILPPPDNAKRKQIAAIIARRAELLQNKPPMPFDITKLQFVLKDKLHITEIEPGKTLHVVCCSETLKCLEGLVPYAPNERDFALFTNVFSQPHILRTGGTVPQIIQEDRQERLDFFFQTVEEKVLELSRPDLKEYFFECIEIDMRMEIYRRMSGKWKFPIMKFIERLEGIKQKALLENTFEISEQNNREMNPDFTTARQVLAVHYLLEFCQVRGVDQTHKAKFAEFLTGKNYKNIYDLVRNPLTTKTGSFRRNDLKFIRPFFENLGLVEIVKMIDNELSTKEE